MPTRPDKLPGVGLLGWLGRQVGHVAKAVKTDVVAPPPLPVAPQVVYREGRVEQVAHPTRPGVVLRRTIVDEVVVDPDPAPRA